MTDNREKINNLFKKNQDLIKKQSEEKMAEAQQKYALPKGLATDYVVATEMADFLSKGERTITEEETGIKFELQKYCEIVKSKLFFVNNVNNGETYVFDGESELNYVDCSSYFPNNPEIGKYKFKKFHTLNNCLYNKKHKY